MNTNAFNTSGRSRSLAYQSMVIRYWREDRRTQGEVWRCSLVDPQTGKQIGFKSFAELSAFLAAEFEAGAGW